jgi:hypothetical protein
MKFLKLLTLLVFIMKLLSSALAAKAKKYFRHRHKIQPPELSFNPLPREYHTAPRMNFARNFNQKHEEYNRRNLVNTHTYQRNDPIQALLQRDY